MKKLVIPMFIALIALTFTACSIVDDPGTDPENPQKTVKSIKFYNYPDEYENSLGIHDPYLSQQYNFAYDAEGRIAKLEMIETDRYDLPNGGSEFEENTETVSFTYNKQDDGNLMIEVMPEFFVGTSEHYYNDKECLYCDKTGKIIKAKIVISDFESMSGSDSNDADYTYEYNDQDQLVKTIEVEEGIYASFTWSNDNMTGYKTSIYEPISGNITYTDTKNDANIDLAYFVCFFNSTETLAFPHEVERGTMSGHFGKRVANMPGAIEEDDDKFTYEYKVNADGYIYEINKIDSYDSSKTRIEIEYMN